MVPLRVSASSRRADGDQLDQLSAAASPVQHQEEEEVQEEKEGVEEAPPLNATESNMEVVKEAIRRITEEDLDVAIEKYDLADELSAKIDYGQINAFTENPFGGNPAAVCYLPYEKESAWMQLVARQFNLSETAFLVKRWASSKKVSLEGEKALLELDANGKSLKAVKRNLAPTGPKNEFDLRWFTPQVEVDLCGHATLAAAHILFTSGIVEDDIVIFHTRSGVLKAKKIGGYDEPPPKGVENCKQRSGTGVVELDFPLVPASKCESAEVEKLSDVLGNVQIVWAGLNSLGDYLVEVPSANDVKQLKPYFEKMLEFEGRGGLIVTSVADPDSEFDFISRFFCPKAGIPEDPVTGSAHCTLGPYWADKLQKDTLEAYQASERGGRVSVIVDKVGGRVNLQGSAVLVMVGTLLNSHIVSS